MRCSYFLRGIPAALCAVGVLVAQANSPPLRDQEEIAQILLVIKSEYAANGWLASEYICFSVNGDDPSRKMVKTFRQSKLNVHSSAESRKDFKCSFQVDLQYVHSENPQAVEILAKVVDFREINSGVRDLAVIVRNGEYTLQLSNGKWSVKAYKSLG